MPKGVLLVHLSRLWPPDVPRDEQKDLWEKIKAGRKTSEFRDITEYWTKRIFLKSPASERWKMDIRRQKVHRIWFVVGYPKGNAPRLEADITNIIVDLDDEGYVDTTGQFEIQFENVVEVTEPVTRL